MKITDYYTPEELNKFYSVIDKYETPFILCNLDIVQKNYYEIINNINAKVYYAIKANPSKQIITLLHTLGCNFDIASKYELDQVLSLNISPAKISYGNTIKKVKDIQYFYDKGVRLFVTDSLEDIKNIAQYAPGSKVFCRILIDPGVGGAEWPLSTKFGCSINMAIQILKYANEHNLIPYGISFHVGSQQRNQAAWYFALLHVKDIFDKLKQENLSLSMINIGGGLPINYKELANQTSFYLNKINEYINTLFSQNIEILIEPGRSLVGNCGITVTEVINKTTKDINSTDNWVFIDAGVFNGFIETLNESIKYPCFVLQNDSQDMTEYTIGGPTCDSMDILYRNTKVTLPTALCTGDTLLWLSTGAYTRTYSSIEFNGFPTIPLYII